MAVAVQFLPAMRRRRAANDKQTWSSTRVIIFGEDDGKKTVRFNYDFSSMKIAGIFWFLFYFAFSAENFFCKFGLEFCAQLAHIKSELS